MNNSSAHLLGEGQQPVTRTSGEGEWIAEPRRPFHLIDNPPRPRPTDAERIAALESDVTALLLAVRVRRSRFARFAAWWRGVVGR